MTHPTVSRTCTAPFDRLKIFLITRPPDLGGTSLSPQAPVRGVKAIGGAIAQLYAEGGVRAFWTGNGLSVAKILPESAIKFLTYESSVGRISTFNQPELTALVCTARNALSRSTWTGSRIRGISAA